MAHAKDKEYRNSGQAIVELALMLPIFLVIIFGFIQVSYVLLAQQTITYAAREGARAGALTNSNEQIENAVWNAVANIDEQDESGQAVYTQVAIDPADESDPLRDRGNKLTVTVTYPFHLNVPLVEAGAITLTSSASQRMEYE